MPQKGQREKLEGRRFGHLIVQEFIGMTTSYSAMYRCICDCGKETTTKGARLKSGHTKSCGCLRDESLRKSRTTHGMAPKNKRPVEYNAYIGAKGRCNNPSNGKYWDYGGRGIEFRFISFEQFYKEVGAKPNPLHSLGRINNEGHYEVGNVRWETAEEQANNKRHRTPDQVNCDLLVAYAKAISAGR